MTRTPFLFPLLALILASCAADDEMGGGGSGPDGGGGGPDGGGEALVNGIPASEYYAQFLWEETATYSSGAAAFPEQDGYDAYLAHLFLMKSGERYLFYGEGEGDVTSTGHSLNLDPSTYTRETGSWSIDGSTLLIGDVMHCDGLSFNGDDVLQCQLDRAIVSDAAVGRTAILKIGFGESTPFDSEWSEYE